MSLIDDLRNIDPNEYLLAGALFVSTFAPGFMVVLSIADIEPRWSTALDF